MPAKVILTVVLYSLNSLPGFVLAHEGKAIIVDGVNDFGDEYLIEIDTLDPPPYADDSLYKAMGIGDASIHDNWNFWVGPDTNLLANPVEMGRLFVTNDMFYLYIGLDHTDTDGLPSAGGGFGYWSTQIGVAIDVNSTPTGGNQASWSAAGFTDPWGNNQEFIHEHRPDYVTWFDHHSDDFKLYRWYVGDESWVELTQDSVDLYHEEFFLPGYILLKGEDGVPHKEPGDPGPYSGADRFVEFQIPLISIGIDYGSVVWDTLRTVPPESLPSVVSIQAWCAQPGKGAFDVVPSDDQICRYPSMGDWSEGSRTTKLKNYVHYELLPYRDQIPPDIEFEELPTSEILTSSAKGLERVSVVALITDKVSPMSKKGSVATVREARVYYTPDVEMRIDTLVDTSATGVDTLVDTSWVVLKPLDSLNVQQMVHIEGTEFWIADIPDTLFFMIWAKDIGGPNVATLPPALITEADTMYVVYSPPQTSQVEWSEPIAPETTTTIFIPDGTMLTIPQGELEVGWVRIFIPDSSTFAEPSWSTFSPPYATTGKITPLGVFRKIAIDQKRVLNLPAQLMFHYTEGEAQGLKEGMLRIYHWNEETERWTRCGGHPDPEANVVTAAIMDLGVYGLFYDPNVGERIVKVIDDVRLDPNPFSPNGDGFYDNLSIQFSLNTDAFVRISVYDIDGELVKTVTQEEKFVKGIHNIIWDGRDEAKNYVPYGFYFVFIYVKSSTTDLPLDKFSKGIGVIR